MRLYSATARVNDHGSSFLLYDDYRYKIVQDISKLANYVVPFKKRGEEERTNKAIVFLSKNLDIPVWVEITGESYNNNRYSAYACFDSEEDAVLFKLKL